MNAPIEPHGDIREGAATMMQFYAAYLEVGFTPQQAMQLIVAMIPNIGAGGGGEQ